MRWALIGRLFPDGREGDLVEDRYRVVHFPRKGSHCFGVMGPTCEGGGAFGYVWASFERRDEALYYAELRGSGHAHDEAWGEVALGMHLLPAEQPPEPARATG